MSNQQMVLLLSALLSCKLARVTKPLSEAAKDHLQQLERSLWGLIKTSGHKIHSERLMYGHSVSSELEHFKKLAEEELLCEHGATDKASCGLCTPETKGAP